MSPQSHIYVQQAPATGASLTSRISPAVGRVQFSPSKKSTASSSSIQQPEFIPDSHWLSHRPSASPASKFKKRKGKVKNVGQSVAGGTSGSGGVRLLDRISGLNVDDGVEAMDDGLQVSSRPEPPASRQEETAKESATVGHLNFCRFTQSLNREPFSLLLLCLFLLKSPTQLPSLCHRSQNLVHLHAKRRPTAP